MATPKKRKKKFLEKEIGEKVSLTEYAKKHYPIPKDIKNKKSKSKEEK